MLSKIRFVFGRSGYEKKKGDEGKFKYPAHLI